MAYVTPNSMLQLFKGINLDNRYLHTIYFANETAQNTWFTSKVFQTFGNLSYQRYSENVIRVQADASTLLGVSYLRFKNTRTASKWFYAFVLGVEYVNETTCDIHYEIDVMQTWFIQNGTIKPCMVLREHVNNDSFGSNLEAEPIGSDVYDCDFIGKFDEFGDYSVVIVSTGKPIENDLIIKGMFNGTHIETLPCTDRDDAEAIATYLEDTLFDGNWDTGEQKEDIIDLYTVPSFLCNSNNIQEHGLTGNNKIYIPNSYDNYTPKNKKLIGYPFSYLLCTTHNGDGQSYKWEYFEGTIGSEVEFRMTGTFLGGGQVVCYPKSYNGQADNLDCKVTMDDFPKNSFNFDAYQAWVASGGKTKLINDSRIVNARGASSMLDLYSNVISNATYNPNKDAQNIGVSMGLGIVNAISGTMKTLTNLQEAQNKIEYRFKDAHYQPNINVGASTPSYAVGDSVLNFYFYHCHVRDDEAKRLDDFLSCYGYAVNKVKTPNLTGRQYWNFVQTQNAVIDGDMPSSSKEAIAKIFDGGITFWHNGDDVGNYAQSVTNGSINNPII